jgi:hypothetical protein
MRLDVTNASVVITAEAAVTMAESESTEATAVREAIKAG